MQKFSTKFPPSSETNWRDLAQASIKGANFESTLIKYSEDGIAKGPLFTKDDIGNSMPVRKFDARHLDGRPWHVGALCDYPDIKTANLDLLDELKGGASSILLNLGTDEVPSLQLRSRNDAQRVLSGVHSNLVPINIMPSAQNFEVAAILASHFVTDPKLKDVQLSLGYAPNSGATQIGDVGNWVLINAPHWKALSVNARAAHEAGGSPAQELALMLTMGCLYIRSLLSADIAVDQVVDLIDVYLASDQDAHQGIVKFRAARTLWAKLTESFGAPITDQNCNIHAISSERMMAAQDPWSNLIRLSAASVGAICGGVDTITLNPFTQAVGLATPFAKRVSRNIQLMMMEESHLGQVNDPAYGSFMHEKLSNELAEKAWGIFQHMQTEDDPLEWLETEIAKTANVRARKIDTNELLLVGVNQFAKPDVRKAEVRKRPQIKPRSGEIISASSFNEAVKQAENGLLSPQRTTPKYFKNIRLSEKFDRAGNV